MACMAWLPNNGHPRFIGLAYICNFQVQWWPDLNLILRLYCSYHPNFGTQNQETSEKRNFLCPICKCDCLDHSNTRHKMNRFLKTLSNIFIKIYGLVCEWWLECQTFSNSSHCHFEHRISQDSDSTLINKNSAKMSSNI